MSPRGDRSIRNIPVSSIHKKRPTRFEAEEYEEEEQQPRRPRKKSRGSRTFLFAAIGVAIVFGIVGLLLSTLFAGASVTVYARSASLPSNLSISAQPNAPAGTLSYATLTITSSATTTVAASGVQHVSKEASGVITITNAYSSQNQRLIANTRFASPDGKIYRIHDSVVVPGMQGGTPGTVTATVYADSPGPDYNIGATHFTIPGFKGDPQYDKIYADTTDGISGGFNGDQPAVAQADLNSAESVMASKLQDAAKSSFKGQLPQGYLIVDNTYQFAYSNINQAPQGSDKATLSQTLTATVAVVRASDAAAAAAKQSVDNYDGSAVAFQNPDGVTIAAASSTKPVGAITIAITGATGIVWQYDKNAVKSALVGKNKTDFQNIITSFRPAITGADVTIRPFWTSTFPSDPNKITVVDGVKK